LLSKKSIRNKFILQLVPASAVLIIVFSVGLYQFIKASIVDDIKSQLIGQAQYEAEKNQKGERYRSIKNLFNVNGANLGVDINPTRVQIVIETQKEIKESSFERVKKEDKEFLVLFYPVPNTKASYVRIDKDITHTGVLLKKILQSILIINFIAIFMIIFYAIILSKTLMSPITTLTKKLAKMNEGFLKPIDNKDLPREFEDLGASLNKLINRIQTFLKYQKELFIGIAHELRTPLAVMKTKNEVTLMRNRDVQKYIETIKININSINDMTSMIGNVLEIGRQESAQFEKPKKLELIKFLNGKIRDFKLLANKDRNIKIIGDLQPQQFETIIQRTLLVHILQNFVQNAVKFTQQNGVVIIKVYRVDKSLAIDVIDEGIGIDESKDLFAPFKRYGNESGAGLGLFLAKGAADAIGATLSLKNRKDRAGVVASVILSNEEIDDQ